MTNIEIHGSKSADKRGARGSEAAGKATCIYCSSLSFSLPLSFSACVGLKCSSGSNPLIFVTVISGLMALI